jgi:AraC-like DNA-binding protein
MQSLGRRKLSEGERVVAGAAMQEGDPRRSRAAHIQLDEVADQESQPVAVEGEYASQLGCSEKSLNRATRTVVDMSAKALLLGRIVLEAKRLLAHSTSPVAVIAADLGFDEPTNFVKFFRRETGMTPGGFRGRHAGPPGIALPSGPGSGL